MRVGRKRRVQVCNASRHLSALADVRFGGGDGGAPAIRPYRSLIRSAQVTIAVGTQNTLVQSYDGLFDYTLRRGG